MKKAHIEVVLLALVAGLAGLMFMRPIWDIDIFWHIATGRWIAENGAIPTTDILGLDPERPWFTFQWGYEWLMYQTEVRGGMLAIRLMHGAVMAAAFALLYRTYRRELKSDGVPWGALALLLFTLMAFQDRINVRPHVFNLLGLALLLPVMLGGWRTLAAATWIGLAVWMFVWANLHAGGWLIMVVALGAIPAAAIVERKEVKRGVALWLTLVVPGALAPNVITGILHAAMLVQTTGETIGEWSPPFAYLLMDEAGLSRLIAGVTPYVTLLTLLGLVMTRRLRGIDLSVIGAAVALTALSLKYVRFIYDAAPVWLIIASRVHWSERMATIARKGATVLCAVFLGLIWQTNIHQLYGGLGETVAAARHDVDERRFPVEAAQFLKETGFEGKVFCHGRFGGYLLWQLHPNVRVRADGRFNVEPSVMEDVNFVFANHRTQHEAPEIAAKITSIYNKYEVDALVLERPGFGPGQLNCREWFPLQRTRSTEVYVRATPKNVAWMKAEGLRPTNFGDCNVGATPPGD